MFIKNIKVFLANLKDWRTTLGITQEEAGKVIGVTKSGYAKKEAGTRPISYNEAYELIMFFNDKDLQQEAEKNA